MVQGLDQTLRVPCNPARQSRRVGSGNPQEQEQQRQREQEAQCEQNRQAQRAMIVAELDELQKKEQAELARLLSQKQTFEAYILKVQEYLDNLKSRITDLQADSQLGRAFGMGGRGGFGSRQDLVPALTQEYHEYNANLKQTQAYLQEVERQLQVLRPNYERRRDQLLAEFNKALEK